MFAVTGRSTTIVAELETLTGDTAVRIDAQLEVPGCEFAMPTSWPMEGWRYVLAAGYLAGKSLQNATGEETAKSWLVNFVNTARLADAILARDHAARICLVGSMSAIAGSYDWNYAGSKAALHLWARCRALAPAQQLVVVAPTIISDSGMTRRRSDYPKVLDERETVTARDVAAYIRNLLWEPLPRVPERGVFTLRASDALLGRS